MWDISSIFYEKQDGSLCAMHCLNSVLQGSYFTAIDLGELAKRLDDEERTTMTESGIESDDYRKFLEQPSGNMDDTGYFSVQVIMKALSLWNLELVPLFSTDEYTKQIQDDPSKASAFVLHMENHWFCVRRYKVNTNGGESVAFFNLNSLLSKPEYMSSLYLTEYLKQMQNEGYSIFVVKGTLPECPADLNPPKMRPKSYNATSFGDFTKSPSKNVDSTESATKTFDLTKSPSTSSAGENDIELQRVIELSLQSAKKPAEDYDSDLEKAMRLSLECFGNDSET